MPARTIIIALSNPVLCLGGILLVSPPLLAGEASGVAHAQQELQRFGAEAAQAAKKAEDAAQKAEGLADKLAGTGQSDTQAAARSARQQANAAKAKADEIQQMPQTGDSNTMDRARQALSDVRQMSDQATQHAGSIERSQSMQNESSMAPDQK